MSREWKQCEGAQQQADAGAVVVAVRKLGISLVPNPCPWCCTDDSEQEGAGGRQTTAAAVRRQRLARTAQRLRQWLRRWVLVSSSGRVGVGEGGMSLRYNDG